MVVMKGRPAIQAMAVRLLIPSMLVFILCAIQSGKCQTVDEDTCIDEDIDEIEQRALYHFEELQKHIDQMSILRTKRDDRGAQEAKKNAFLFDSLLNFCHKMQDFNDETDTSEDEDEDNEDCSQPNTSPACDSEEEEWLQPRVRPIRVQAIRRERDSLILKFDVMTSGPSEAMRVSGLDVEVIKIPESHSSVKHIEFKINTSSICQEARGMNNDVVIFQPTRRSGATSAVSIDLCKFDQFQDQNVDRKHREWKMKKGPFIEEIKINKFRIDSNITDEINVRPGQNENFEMTVEVSKGSYIDLYAAFYDHKTRKMIKDRVTWHYMRGENGIGRQKQYTDGPQLLSVQVLTSSQDGDSSMPEFGDDEKTRVRMRVTLFTESAKFTGKLYLTTLRKQGDYYNRTIVETVESKIEIKIKRPQKDEVFPRKKVLFQDNPTLICDDSSMLSQQLGDNCTLFCSVIGRDIQDMSISRKDPSENPNPVYQKMFFMVGDWGFCMVDVGKPSPENNGTYECSVTLYRGLVQKQEIQLSTSGSSSDFDFDSTSDGNMTFPDGA